MSDITSLKRPKATDKEEELFRMQEEFLRSKQQPSAKIINLSNQHKQESVPGVSHSQSSTSAIDSNKKVQSRFSETKKLKTLPEKNSIFHTNGEVINSAFRDNIYKNLEKKPCDVVQNIPLCPSNVILGNIVERKHRRTKYEFQTDERISNSRQSGFPEVFVTDLMNSNENHSLFWQKASKRMCMEDLTNTHNEKDLPIEANDSALIEGPWASEIHETNLQKLKEMTAEEIQEEKAKLEATLTPELIQFLKDRKNKKYKLQEENMNTDESNKVSAMEVAIKIATEDTSKDVEKMDFDNEVTNIPTPPLNIFEQAKKKGWVHMDSLEPEKLEWMEDIPADKDKEPAPEEPYNARFDFNGLLLPFKDKDLTVNKGLHHHGEEPERPGYSLQELLQLSRSSAQQQRCMALTTLANIMEKSRKGWYDKALQPAPLCALSQRNILLLLRFSLDDSSIAVVSATLLAIRAFLFSEADELCLDRIFECNKCIEPILIPPRDDITDTSNLKDHELAQLDAIEAAMRSDIVLRIRYILSEMHPPVIGVNSALEILIRLTRRSHINAINIASTANLLAIVVKNFIPLSLDKIVSSKAITDAYGAPITSAVRLCRTLICYGGKAVAERLNNLNILRSILLYISSDTGKNGINLSIESLRLWKMMLLNEVAMDSISGMHLTLLSQLQLLLSNHDIRNSSELACEHATALIAVASYEVRFKETVALLLSKWSTQLELVSTPSWAVMKLVGEALETVRDATAFKTAWLSNTKIFALLCSCSNLLSGLAPAVEREPSCLPSLGVLTEDGQLQPLVSRDSCIPLLASCFNFFYNQKLTSEMKLFFNQPGFYNYLKRLVSYQWSLERSWYTRMELSMLTIVVKCAFILKEELSTEMVHTVWKISIKLISALPADTSSDVKDILSIALYNEKLKLEMIVNELAKLSLDTNDVAITIDMKHDIASVYEKYVTTNGAWNQAAMPKDWLYLPLVHIYSNCKKNKTCNDEDRKNILAVLSLELVLPELVEQLSQNLRFSRLILIYLCDTVYLNKDVSILLFQVISNLLRKCYKKLDFTTNLPGLNSFTDLFTAMCEHFCSTSYGDDNFAMVLLVPIAQRHSVHYRKLLWSEHAGVLRYLRLPLEKLVIPVKEYLYPTEQDTSLIESYLLALVRNTIRQEWCPIPYMIAVHHSAMYLKNSNRLANRMRTQVQKLPNQGLANTLLNYEPPQL